jgi:hypothetical protein
MQLMNDSVIRDIKIESSTGIVENIGAEQVGERTYMLLENPLFSCHINYGTVVKAVPNDKGELVMAGIAKQSDYKTRQFLLSANAKECDFVKKIGNPIIAAGGTWEVAMGGIAFIHFQKDSTFDVDAFFKDNHFNVVEIKEDN